MRSAVRSAARNFEIQTHEYGYNWRVLLNQAQSNQNQTGMIGLACCTSANALKVFSESRRSLPVLHELTPLKELFLQQRAPRFVITGANTRPLQEIVATLFAWSPPAESREILMELFRWHAMELGGRGTVSFLDARGADRATLSKIDEELKTQPADLLLHLAEDDSHAIGHPSSTTPTFLAAHPGTPSPGRRHCFQQTETRVHRQHNGDRPGARRSDAVVPGAALQQHAGVGPHLLQVVEVQVERRRTRRNS
jgi:hypothetical protein